MSNEGALPMKKTATYTRPIGLKVESALKSSLEKLDLAGIDVPELCRIGIRKEVEAALKKVKV